MRSERERARRLEFFFGDYIDSGSDVLEVGPGDGWLGDYLIGAGFLGYRRLHVAPPADLVGELGHWRALELQPASVDLLVAFHATLGADELAAFRDLVRPGGLLFVIRPAPAFTWRAVVGRCVQALGRTLRGSLPRVPELAGFRTLAARRLANGALWLRLQRLAEAGDGTASER